MVKILDRNTISESWQMLVIGVVMIAGVFFATAQFSKILSLICDLGIEPSTALIITTLQLPGIVVGCLPTGILLSTGILLWRRTFDYELLGLQVSGISPRRMLAPFFIMAFAATAVSFVLTDSVIPECLTTTNKLFVSGLVNSNLPRSEKCLTFFQYDESQSTQPLKQILLAGRNLDKSLQNVIIFELAKTQAHKIIWAKSGEWHRGQWQLADGHIYELVSDSSVNVNMTFKKLGVDAMSKLTDSLANHGPFSNEMTTSELKQMIDKQSAEGKPVSNSMMLRYLRRFSQPAACIFLLFTVLPLCVATPRRRSFVALGYIGVVVAGYFVLEQVAIGLGDHSRLPAIVAAWLPAAASVVVGLAGYVVAKARN